MTDLAGKKTAYYNFTGVIDQNGVTRFAAALNKAVNESCDEVYICVNSLGGYIAEGVSLYNYMRGLPVTIIAHNLGSMASIAVAVFVGANVRYCSKHATFMMHPTAIGPFNEPLPWERLDAARFAALAEDARTEDILRERTNIPDDFLAARRVKEVHVTPDQALEWGLVHSVREFSLPKGNEILQV